MSKSNDKKEEVVMKKTVNEIKLTNQQLRLLPQVTVNEMLKKLKGVKKNLAVVKLYIGRQGKWEFVHHGCLFLVEDSKCLCFHLLDIKTTESIWSHELYENITIHLLSDYFVSFEGTEGNLKETCVWGISFADVSDGQDFCRKTLSVVSSKYPKKKKGNLFSGIKNFFNKTKKPKNKKKKKRTSVMISSPKNFKKLRHVGNLDLPEDWLNFLINDVGISKKELQDEKTVDKIFKVLKMFEKPGNNVSQEVVEEKAGTDEQMIISQIEEITNSIERLEKKREELFEKLKILKKSNDEEYEDDGEISEAEEEDWIESGENQMSSPLPTGSPSALPGPAPPNIDEFVFSDDRIKDNNRKKGKNVVKRKLPPLTQEVKLSVLEIMKKEMDDRRKKMRMRLEDQKKESKEGDGEWSEEESEED